MGYLSLLLSISAFLFSIYQFVVQSEEIKKRKKARLLFEEVFEQSFVSKGTSVEFSDRLWEDKIFEIFTKTLSLVDRPIYRAVFIELYEADKALQIKTGRQTFYGAIRTYSKDVS